MVIEPIKLMASGSIKREIKTYTTNGITKNISATGDKFAEFVFDISSLGANEIIGIIPISDQSAWTTVNVRRLSNTSVTIQSHNLHTVTLSTTIYLIVTYR